jgi:hypothetical protein
MGTTACLSLSIALRTDAADRSETSCSPLRPPSKMPTQSFYIPFPFARNARLRSKKLEQRLVKLCSLLDLRNVAAVLDHEQLGSSYAITKFFAAGQRN